MALIQALEEAVRSGDERDIKRAVRELRRWLDWVGPRYFGLMVQDTWIGAPPERRRMIEEMAEALESVHKEAARWAQYYIERAKRAEAEGQLRPRVILAQVLRAWPCWSPHWETGRNGSQKIEVGAVGSAGTEVVSWLR
ncbi:MAG: hypothetical protein RXR82_07920 [Nitrososphaeria archaeon]